MDLGTEVYQAPRTTVLAWRLLACAALVILLQVIPVGYALVTADSWVPLAEDDFGQLLGAESIPAIQANDLLAALELVGLAVIVALAALGVRRGRDWGRALVPAITLFVLLACATGDVNRLKTEVYWSHPPVWVELVAYGFLLMYPLLIAGSVLVLLRSSRRHFIPR